MSCVSHKNGRGTKTAQTLFNASVEVIEMLLELYLLLFKSKICMWKRVTDSGSRSVFFPLHSLCIQGQTQALGRVS